MRNIKYKHKKIRQAREQCSG